MLFDFDLIMYLDTYNDNQLESRWARICFLCLIWLVATINITQT